MKFKYLKFPLSHRSEFFGSHILKPIIPIGIASKDGSFDYNALIDSGADFSIFDSQIAQVLGLDLESGIPVSFGGVQDAGIAKAYLHEITLIVGGNKYKTLVGFSDDIAKHGFAILGQKGFFDMFSITFDLAREDIELKKREQ